MLTSVVTDGTALEADLSTFLLAGKTGTARRTVGGRYAAMQYYATFAGLFPADRPQLVILVKLDSPKDSYYGGHTAAPVTRAVLEAALAARDAALDRAALAGALSRRDHAPGSAAGSAGAPPSPRSAPTVQLAGEAVPRPPSTPRVVLRLPYGAPRPAPRVPRPVPQIHGLELRDAVRALHSAGFHVQIERMAAMGGSAGATSPAAGTLAPAGSIVRIFR
jgi:cell division protein FtsI (penicillin-binding protein 3)